MKCKECNGDYFCMDHYHDFYLKQDSGLLPFTFLCGEEKNMDKEILNLSMYELLSGNTKLSSAVQEKKLLSKKGIPSIIICNEKERIFEVWKKVNNDS